MEHSSIVKDLSKNKDIFKSLLSGLSKDEILWKQTDEKWCLLEIICHLCDEEVEDFRTRTKHVLESRESGPHPIDPQGWVVKRDYINQDFDKKLEEFLLEREKSISWLNSLDSPNWENSYVHPELGTMTGWLFLTNWLAHDYLHIRQIMKLKFDYLKENSKESLSYAGNW